MSVFIAYVNVGNIILWKTKTIIYIYIYKGLGKLDVYIVVQQ